MWLLFAWFGFDHCGVVTTIWTDFQLDQDRARKIAKQGTAWALDTLSMQNVWCYWLSLLSGYSKLQRFEQVTLHPDALSFEDSIVAPNPGQKRAQCSKEPANADSII